MAIKNNISIIIPVYNVEKYIASCIESILNQTTKDFELILVDDGSTDNSGHICDFYATQDNRVSCYHKKNEGVSIARNFGISKSKYNWISFIDSDDWVENNYLESFYKYEFEEKKLIIQGILYDYSDIKTNIKRENKFFFRYNDKKFSIRNKEEVIDNKILENGCPIGKLFNKNILIENNIFFDKNISTHEDHLFVWTYLQHIDTIQLSDAASYHYMKREIVTLSAKFHPSEELIDVSDKLIHELNKLKDLCNISKTEYLKKVYSDFGLYQLIEAAYNINRTNFKTILKSIKQRKDRFSLYNNKSLKGEIISRLLTSKIPPIILYFLIILYKKTK